MSVPNIIAIDGPAASGKSTLGWKLAEYLGYICLDTGVMYRALTWAALDRGIDPADESAVSDLAWNIDIDVRASAGDAVCELDVFVDGYNASSEIRSPDVESAVSQVSAYPKVRQAMTLQQRRIGNRGKVIMIGRDIGTVVLPDADLKIYLDASPEVRARRRYEENLERGEPVDYETILTAIRRRDEFDSNRAVAPLRPADDAVILNSEGLGIEQVFEAAKSLFE
ncbi:MAG: (d)CMP kinase [Anaerolineaceae bacterium]|nr:(d)CMP kinase [Anaerolineaceae bacterium]